MIYSGFAVKVKNWDEAVFIGERFSGYVFRGQPCDKWPLRTKLERAVKKWGIPEKKIQERERRIISEFQRRAHHYIQDPPQVDNLLEWVALIQHYGGPTRLLDVTLSFYVASFFAMEFADGDAVVWAINRGKTAEKEHMDGPIVSNDSTLKECNDILAGKTSGQGIIFVQPFRMNHRLAVQQGAFLFPRDVTKSFEEELSFTIGTNPDLFHKENPQLRLKLLPQIIKIIIPKEHHSTAMRALSRMNISSASLFEGLDGFARSLHTMLRIYD